MALADLESTFATTDFVYNPKGRPELYKNLGFVDRVQQQTDALSLYEQMKSSGAPLVPNDVTAAPVRSADPMGDLAAFREQQGQPPKSPPPSE